MIELLCPKCRRPCYTANTRGPWRCPYCGAEIDLGLDKVRLLSLGKKEGGNNGKANSVLD